MVKIGGIKKASAIVTDACRVADRGIEPLF